MQAGYAMANLEVGDPVTTYRRSWRERLLSWPWRPWLAVGVRYANEGKGEGK